MLRQAVKRAQVQPIIYGLFSLSGFAGLIYESIWSHYLKLFLGHAAYAQTLVLVIFMGGMAAGAWLAGEYSRRLKQPLLAYVAVETLLGLCALVFDPTFRGMQAWVFEALIPVLDSAVAVEAAKWTLAAGIILPQSVLLGATFPLISAGLIRLSPAAPGRALGWLYFTNSLGAALGVLASGFILIDKVGLPGTILTAGLINFGLALGVYFIARLAAAPSVEIEIPDAARPAAIAHDPALPRLMLAAAFLTGAASFFYEIGWIRMLALVLGSATHSFELMLSAFIFGLAAGSFFIRRRIDRATRPLELLAWIQLAMSLLAMLSLPLYMKSFDAMAAFYGSVQGNDGGYVLFNVFSHALCFVLMLPATFCAGMTLPLITGLLLRNGHGERSIGRIYAFNTLGAIVGILLAVHLVMPYLGLRQVVVAGAGLDLVLGLYLLRRSGSRLGGGAAAAIMALLLVQLGIGLGVRFDPAVTASGVYRHGEARAPGEVLMHRDGKTATVDVIRQDDGNIYISTNGKVDAGINPTGAPGTDDYTTLILALLPLSMHEDPAEVALIGMGSGSTTAGLLLDGRIRRLDTIEIEPAMIEGARYFGEVSARAYTDSRSHIHIEDAKSYFARAGQRYDVIVSEPSNPWVSGIATLFSTEFYAQVQRYLKNDGLFVQWLQMYEIDTPLMATVLNALGENFADYAIYLPNDDDIIIVASPDRPLPRLSGRLFESQEFAGVRRRLKLQNLSDLEIRRLGLKSTLQPFFAAEDMPTNSDYFPVLDQNAGRQRFVSAHAREIMQIHPYSLRLHGDRAVLGLPLTLPVRRHPVPVIAIQAQATAREVLARAGVSVSQRAVLTPEMAQTVHHLRLVADSCSVEALEALWFPALRQFVMDSAFYLPAALSGQLADSMREARCWAVLGGESASWAGLLEAIGMDDIPAIRTLTASMLASTRNDAAASAFLLSELLLADLRAGDFAAAERNFQLWAGPLPRTVPLRYLRANILARTGDAR